MNEPQQAKGSMTAPGVQERPLGTQHGTGVTIAEAMAEGELAHAAHAEPLPPARSAWRERLVTTAAVSAGGLLGANARYLVGLGVSERFGAAFPWGTLLINVSGSFILGFYLTLVTERFVGRSTTRLFLATGFLGAYTTFSTFSYETVQLVAAGASLSALAYVVGSLLLGIAAAVAGILGAHAL